jgi:hypothetical protein
MMVCTSASDDNNEDDDRPPEVLREIGTQGRLLALENCAVQGLVFLPPEGRLDQLHSEIGV